MDDVKEDLYLDDFDAPHSPIAAANGGFFRPQRCFTFELNRKETLFSDIRVDQFWMPIRSIYGQRNCTARNGDTIVDYFWTLCRREGSFLETDVADSYILAKLLPYARSNGSRRVFEDAVLSQARRLSQGKYDLIRELDIQLSQIRGQEMDRVAFRDQTANLLEPPKYPEETWVRYRQFEQDLLGYGNRELAQRGTAGLQAALARWQKWMKSTARHRGNDLDKRILDILSYECRAAMHRCYSAVWYDLLPHLANKYHLSDESVLYHRLWHLEQSSPSDDARSYFHLFNGHIFALHPGTWIFVQTRTGAELIADVLREASLGSAFGRLLYGLMVAIAHYANRGEIIHLLRKCAPKSMTHVDVEAAYADQVSQSGRRRKKGPPDD